MTSPRGRVVLGFVVAPLVAPIVFDVMTVLESAVHGAIPSLGVLGAFFLLFYMAPYAYLATLVVGAPAYLLLHRYGRVQLWEMLLVGAVTAALFVPADSGSIGRALLLFVPSGMASGLVFWLFVREVPSEEPGRAQTASA